MRGIKRVAVLAAVLAVLALAVPASAGSWRNVASVRGVGRSYATAWIGANASATSVKQVQIGLYNGDQRSRSIQTSRYVSCTSSSFNFTSASKDAKVSVGAHKWKWVTIFSRASSWNHCDVNVDAYNSSLIGPLKLKVRVR